MRSAHIPPGKEDLYRRQEKSNGEVARLDAEVEAAEKRRNDLSDALGWDDPLTDEADEELGRKLNEHNRAVAVADRIYQERMVGLSSWIDHDPTAPVCAQCRGAGCKTCRGWGREYRESIPVWNERDQEWVDPATGRTVDLLADPPPKPPDDIHDRRRDRRYDEKPSTPTNAGSAGGAGVSAEDQRMLSDSTLPDPGIGQRKRLHRADGTEVDYERTRGGWRKVDDSDTRDNPDLTERRRAEDQAVEERLERARAEREARTRRAREESARKPPPDLHDRRQGRWYDEKPITTTNNGSAGGTGMASIEEVRAGIAAANEKANEGLGAVQQAHASLEEAQGQLMQATEGSGQADVSEANGLLAQAVNSLEEVRQQVSAAISASEGVAGRL